MRSLSSLVDAVLKDVAPRGIEGERLRRHALQLEREIRRAVDAGASGTLAELWEAAAARLGAREDETLEQVLSHAGGALRADGEVLGCTHDMPARLITHAWQAAQRDKARQFHADLSRLVLKLSDILRAAFSHSQAGRKPQSLKQSLGGPHQARLRLRRPVAHRRQGRAARRAARRHAAGGSSTRWPCWSRNASSPRPTMRRMKAGPVSVSSSTTARPRRRPSASACPRWRHWSRRSRSPSSKSPGRYVEAEHDLVFEAFDEHSLTADDLARFPDYLVCIPPERNDAPENANLMEMLSSGLPVKVLVQTSDLLEEASIGTGHFAFGVRSARLATTAMGLGGMFVLQSPSANLFALRAAGRAAAWPAADRRCSACSPARRPAPGRCRPT